LRERRRKEDTKTGLVKQIKNERKASAPHDAYIPTHGRCDVRSVNGKHRIRPVSSCIDTYALIISRLHRGSSMLKCKVGVNVSVSRGMASGDKVQSRRRQV
jgi:hypothetical protein